MVLLHGWGSNLQSFVHLRRSLEHHFRVYALDLPGFGQSPEPAQACGTEQYAKWVATFLRERGIERPVLLGHSFGGRLCIRLGAQGLASKLVLVDSAGVKPRRGWQYYYRVYSYKLFKKLYHSPLGKMLPKPLAESLQNRFGSVDYRNASDIMRQSLVQVVNEDLRELLPQIRVPTLLLWGDQDEDTPLYQARTMEALIPDAGLVILQGAGHFSYLDKPQDAAIIIEHFLSH